MLKTIPIEELTPGMFVTQVVEQKGRLKMRSRGLVKTQATIDTLRSKGILTLEVDLSRSKTTYSPQNNDVEKAAAETEKRPQKPKKSESEALSDANDLYLQAVNIQGDFINRVKQGQPADISPLVGLSHQVIDSVFDNPNALSCLTLIKNADQYLLEHSLNCSILMAMFANSLGYDKAQVEELGLAGLLMDVGMATIPDDIIKARGKLSKADWELIKTHVDTGVELLEQTDDISDIVLDVVQNHHERVDGSGYPSGKSGEEISTFARMAAIVDCYDAMTSTRHHQESMSATAALKKLLKDPQLDKELVQAFIKCIGVHPVGSLVRLKSDKLAIVSQANKNNPLKPVVMVFYSVRSQTHRQITRLDLAKVDDDIVAAVRPEEFKLNLNKFFRDVFLNAMP
ncbi:HD-GYP domain-containing protein [Aestuariibacter salexigens]|uniref:HD-GYP domain-containing protein n=1 Tax=Aestuariibacter salexigens TaxID=226010 RepID=UPI00041E96F8|nr:HD-GYP domain-containing protein [Aestuariibacter salexigens]